MTPGKYTIKIYKGATFDRTITWTGKDLTGYTARLHMRTAVDATGAPALEMTTGADGRIVLGGTAGTIRLKLTAAETAAMATTDLVYDLELVAGTGEVFRLLEGKVKVYPEVTR